MYQSVPCIRDQNAPGPLKMHNIIYLIEALNCMILSIAFRQKIWTSVPYRKDGMV